MMRPQLASGPAEKASPTSPLQGAFSFSSHTAEMLVRSMNSWQIRHTRRDSDARTRLALTLEMAMSKQKHTLTCGFTYSLAGTQGGTRGGTRGHNQEVKWADTAILKQTGRSGMRAVRTVPIPSTASIYICTDRRPTRASWTPLRALSGCAAPKRDSGILSASVFPPPRSTTSGKPSVEAIWSQPDRQSPEEARRGLAPQR